MQELWSVLLRSSGCTGSSVDKVELVILIGDFWAYIDWAWWKLGHLLLSSRYENKAATSEFPN